MNNPLTAFIIEDDQDLAEIFTIGLKRAGYEPECIYAGDTALARLKTDVPGLVLLDIQLPEVSGLEILKYLNEDRRFKNTRTIIATANPIQVDHLRDEADLVLIKPISVSQLSSLAARLKGS